MCGSCRHAVRKLMKQPDRFTAARRERLRDRERRRRDVRARQGGRRRDPARHRDPGSGGRGFSCRDSRATSGTSGATVPGPRTDHGPEERRTIIANEQAVRHHGSELPPPIALYQMATGHYVSQAIYVAAKLGIADFLADGPHRSHRARHGDRHARAVAAARAAPARQRRRFRRGRRRQLRAHAARAHA